MVYIYYLFLLLLISDTLPLKMDRKSCCEPSWSDSLWFSNLQLLGIVKLKLKTITVFFFRIWRPVPCCSILPQQLWSSKSWCFSTSVLLLVEPSQSRENQNRFQRLLAYPGQEAGGRVQEEGGQHCQGVPEGVPAGPALHKPVTLSVSWGTTICCFPPNFLKFCP